MKAISIPAHYDGERILLDEPVNLEPGSKLLVTVLHDEEAERESWMRLSARMLNNACGDNEPEYPADAIREVNPEYAGG